MKDISSSGPLVLGLNFSDDKILAGSPNEGGLVIPMWNCQNYEVHKNGGIALMDTPTITDGQLDHTNLNMFIVHIEGGALDPSDFFAVGDVTCTTTFGPGAGTSEAAIHFAIPDGVDTDLDGKEWHCLWQPTGPVGFASAALWKSFTIQNGSGTVTMTPTTVYEFANDPTRVYADYAVGVTRGYGNSPPAWVMQSALSKISSITTVGGVIASAPDLTVTFADLPSTGRAGTLQSGLFYLSDTLYAIDSASDNTTVGQTLYKANLASGWATADMGNEMSFDEGVFPITFEDYIAYESTSRASYLFGGTSSSTELDYFPGQVCYWMDTVTGTEYWGDVIHTYVARGILAEGLFTDCEVATTANLDLTDATATDADATIDGFALTAADRVLVKDQDLAEENGIYVVQAAGTAIAAFRATDLDVGIEAVSGTAVKVTGGTESALKEFFLLNVDDLSVGVGGLLWSKGELGEGALTIYTTFSRTSGGTTTADINLPLNTAGTFGKWTEANSLNFIGGDASPEPAVGDEINVSGAETATILKIIIDRGAWSTADASGTLILGEMSGGDDIILTTDQVDIVSGDTDILTPNNDCKDSDRDILFDNTSASVAVTLPTFEDIGDADSQYVSVSHNFFATSDDGTEVGAFPTKRTYITNGGGYALSYDGTYLVRIRTGAVDDTPRHVSVHGNRLCLGFPDGSVSLSVSGEPHNFKGSEGAINLGYSQKVTGLVRLAGDTTAIFTTSTIELLQGTNDLNFVRRVISTNSGAIEYTAVDIGQVVFCDRHGISTLQQAEAYGDFAAERVSQRVDDYLLPRIKASKGLQHQKYTTGGDDSRGGKNIDHAIAFSSKAQYRLYFADGDVLVATWTRDAGVQFARHVVFGPSLQMERHFIPAHAVGVTSDGKDAIYKHWAGNNNYTFRMDAIPGLWDNDAITAPPWIVFGPIFPTAGTSAVSWETIRIHGIYDGYLNLVYRTSNLDYLNPVDPTIEVSPAVGSLADDPYTRLTNEFFVVVTSYLAGTLTTQVLNEDQKREVGGEDNLFVGYNNNMYAILDAPGRGHGLFILLAPSRTNSIRAVANPPHRFTSIALESSIRRKAHS